MVTAPGSGGVAVSYFFLDAGEQGGVDYSVHLQLVFGAVGAVGGYADA